MRGARHDRDDRLGRGVGGRRRPTAAVPGTGRAAGRARTCRFRPTTSCVRACGGCCCRARSTSGARTCSGRGDWGCTRRSSARRPPSWARTLPVDPAVDWLVPASREQPAMLRHGWPLDRLLASLLGRVEAARIPDDVRMLPRQQSIATQLPHAVGIAWASAIRGEPGVTLAYCGDGATSEGDFHEACNLAGVMRCPARPGGHQQPVRDLDAHGAADRSGPAGRPGARLRLPGRGCRRERPARGLRGHPSGRGARPRRRRADPGRGGDLPDELPQHLRQPVALPRSE